MTVPRRAGGAATSIGTGTAGVSIKTGSGGIVGPAFRP